MTNFFHDALFIRILGSRTHRHLSLARLFLSESEAGENYERSQ
jgi:hypothetical protein